MRGRRPSTSRAGRGASISTFVTRTSRLLLLLAVTALVVAPATAVAREHRAHGKIRIWKIAYRAHNGARRNAWVLLPSWYGPRNHPAIPLIVSPHGRGLTGRANAGLWGSLPADGPFAVVNPDGQGRLLPAYSWGSYGQVEDLARMPSIVRRTLPWLRIETSRVYTFGGSMGGQEALLLVARHPTLFAGAAVFDAVTDFALQYREFLHLTCRNACRKIWAGELGKGLQELARKEVGGTPKTAPISFAMRAHFCHSTDSASGQDTPGTIAGRAATSSIRRRAARTNPLSRAIARRLR